MDVLPSMLNCVVYPFFQADMTLNCVVYLFLLAIPAHASGLTPLWLPQPPPWLLFLFSWGPGKNSSSRTGARYTQEQPMFTVMFLGKGQGQDGQDDDDDEYDDDDEVLLLATWPPWPSSHRSPPPELALCGPPASWLSSGQVANFKMLCEDAGSGCCVKMVCKDTVSGCSFIQ